MKNLFYYTAHELGTIFRDTGAILILVIALIIYPLLYSIAYSNETLRDVPVAVVDLDHSAMSRQLSRMADASEQLHVSTKPLSLKEAETLFYEGEINGVILIQSGTERDVLRGKKATVTVYCDASYFLLYKQVYAGATYATGTLSAGVEVKRAMGQGMSVAEAMAKQDPLKTETVTLYNPSGGYGSFVMPGMILIIIQQTLLIGIGMVGGTRREKSAYAKFVEQIAKPFGTVQVLVGKATAYVIISLFNALFAMVLLHHWFGFPDKCNFLYTLPLLIPFFYAVAFMGLAISVFFKQRVHSLMFFVFLSPVVLFLGGISWPTEALPQVLQWAAKLFPSTSAIPAYLRLRVMGAPFTAILPLYVFLLVQMAVYGTLACVAYKVVVKRIGLDSSPVII